MEGCYERTFSGGLDEQNDGQGGRGKNKHNQMTI